MPTYEYYCEKCGSSVEIFVRDRKSFTDEVKCSECDSLMRKKLFPAGVILKGPGFYHTDYGRGKVMKEAARKESETGKSEDEKGSGSSSKKKADQKPAKGSRNEPARDNINVKEESPVKSGNTGSPAPPDRKGRH